LRRWNQGDAGWRYEWYKLQGAAEADTNQRGEERMKRSFSVLLAVVASLLIVNAALAQESPVNIENVRNIVGIGAGIAPDYSGSDHYKAVAAPFFKFTFSEQRYVQLIATELKVNVLNHPSLRMGPVVNYRFGRDDVDNSQVNRMQKIDDTVEAGGFLGFELIKAGNPRQRFIASFEVLADVGDVYNGVLMTLSARYWYPVSLPLDLTIGVSTTVANHSFMATYYGVSPQDSIRSGLPAYDPKWGFRDVSVLPGAVYHLSRSWHLAAGLRYQALVDKASDSPVVKDAGSSNQFIAGLGVAYSW
jgi:outer membrane protein